MKLIELYGKDFYWEDPYEEDCYDAPFEEYIHWGDLTEDDFDLYEDLDLYIEEPYEEEPYECQEENAFYGQSKFSQLASMYENEKNPVIREGIKLKLQKVILLSDLIDEFIRSGRNPIFLLKAFVYAHENKLPQRKIVADYISNAFKKWLIDQSERELGMENKNKSLEVCLGLDVGKGEDTFFQKGAMEQRNESLMEEMYKLQRWFNFSIKKSAEAVSEKHGSLLGETLRKHFYRFEKRQDLSYYPPAKILEALNYKLDKIPPEERETFRKSFPKIYFKSKRSR